MAQKLKRYTEPVDISHRRVRSNTYKALSPKIDLSHHRNLSGSLKPAQPLFQERTQLSGLRGLSTEASSPPTSPPLSQRKPGRGFLGTLDAAILYFETVQHVPLLPVHMPDEVAYLQEELELMTAKANALEQNVAALASEKANHQRQREAYERHIGTLNTQLLDMQMTLDEYRMRLHEESLDLSNVPETWALYR